MMGKDSPQSVIDSYRRRQKLGLWGLVALLVLVGIVILVVWFVGSGNPAAGLFATATPTSTNTPPPTPVPPTATATATATVTLTPTITLTATPSGPVEYTVKENDTCWDIAQKNNVLLDVLVALNGFAPGTCPIKPGDKILIPLPGQELPTSTPVDLTAIPKGKLIEHIVQTGETLAIIAARYNSSVAAILALKENNLTDPNKITIGQKIFVPANIATPTPTPAPTRTPVPGAISATPEPSATATKSP